MTLCTHHPSLGHLDGFYTNEQTSEPLKGKWECGGSCVQIFEDKYPAIGNI